MKVASGAAFAKKAGFANFAKTTELGGQFWKNRLQTAYKSWLGKHEFNLNTRIVTTTSRSSRNFDPIFGAGRVLRFASVPLP